MYLNSPLESPILTQILLSCHVLYLLSIKPPKSFLSFKQFTSPLHEVSITQVNKSPLGSLN